jgi:hypothetical protein
MVTPDMKAAYTAQRTKETVLDAIARMLPFVPRDLVVEVTAEPSKARPGLYSTSISITPLTEMGKAIHPVLQAHLHEELAKTITPREDDDDSQITNPGEGETQGSG